MEDVIYLGFIAAFGFDYAPNGWLPCDGRLLEVSRYAALYSVLGNRFGGDGRNTFGLPDLRGRAPVGFTNTPIVIGNNPYDFISPKPMGAKGGYESFILSQSQLPIHNHSAKFSVGSASITGDVTARMNVSTDAAQEFTPNNNYLAADNGIGTPIYNQGATSGKTMNTNAITVDSSKLAVNLSGFAVEVGVSGSSAPVTVIQPYQAVNYCIATAGVYPVRP